MPRITEEMLSARIAKRLERANIPFAREVPLGGVHVDFAFRTPKNQLIIAEVKSWEPTRANLDRARHQVQLYKERTGAKAAFIVVPGIEHGQPELGLVNENELVRLLFERYRFALAGLPTHFEQHAPAGGLTKWAFVPGKKGIKVAAKKKAATTVSVKRRTISAAARKRIEAATRKRWAAHRRVLDIGIGSLRPSLQPAPPRRAKNCIGADSLKKCAGRNARAAVTKAIPPQTGAGEDLSRKPLTIQ
jgi:hypothetical protein